MAIIMISLGFREHFPFPLERNFDKREIRKRKAVPEFIRKKNEIMRIKLCYACEEQRALCNEASAGLEVCSLNVPLA